MALSSLLLDPQFQTVLGWLKGSLEDVRRDNDSTKDEILARWNQGAAQALAEIVATAEQSQELLRKLK
jgi:hypothetical protein